MAGSPSGPYSVCRWLSHMVSSVWCRFRFHCDPEDDGISPSDGVVVVPFPVPRDGRGRSGPTDQVSVVACGPKAPPSDLDRRRCKSKGTPEPMYTIRGRWEWGPDVSVPLSGKGYHGHETSVTTTFPGDLVFLTLTRRRPSSPTSGTREGPPRRRRGSIREDLTFEEVPSSGPCPTPVSVRKICVNTFVISARVRTLSNPKRTRSGERCTVCVPGRTILRTFVPGPKSPRHHHKQLKIWCSCKR